MGIFEKAKEKLGFFSEWFSIIGPVFALFLWVHHENVHINQKLDQHIIAINERCDQLHVRGDQLHKEFIDLLKERNK